MAGIFSMTSIKNTKASYALTSSLNEKAKELSSLPMEMSIEALGFCWNPTARVRWSLDKPIESYGKRSFWFIKAPSSTRIW